MGSALEKWSNPAAIVALLGARTLSNLILAVVINDATKPLRRYTLAAVALTLCSAVLMFLVVSDRSESADVYEVATQLLLLVFATWAVSKDMSTPRLIGLMVGVVGAGGGLLVTIPVYGEATVAP